MAKVCKYWNGDCHLIKCPKNTDRHCQIIPKRKSKVVRVKAWAGFDPDGKFVYASYKPTKYGRNPCIIEYKEKPNAR